MCQELDHVILHRRIITEAFDSLSDTNGKELYNLVERETKMGLKIIRKKYKLLLPYIDSRFGTDYQTGETTIDYYIEAKHVGSIDIMERL